MTIIDGKEISVAPTPTPEELLAEAQAWGFQSYEDFCAFIEKQAEEQAKQERRHRFPWSWSCKRLSIAVFYASAESGVWSGPSGVMRYGFTWGVDNSRDHFGRALGFVWRQHWFGVLYQYVRHHVPLPKGPR